MSKIGAVSGLERSDRRVVPLSFKKGAPIDGPFVLSVTSGKGGVGKTLTTVHLAAGLAKLGHRVLVFDGDMGLANVDVLMGIQPKATLNDVLEGDAKFNDIIVDGPNGIRLIPSGSGFRNLTKLSLAQRMKLAADIEGIDEPADIMIIDTGAGISDNVIFLNSIAHECLVVTTPEPHALTDAYAIIKVMNEDHGRKSPNLVVNMVQSDAEGLKIYSRLSEVAGRFLNVDIRHAGNVPDDPQTRKAVVMRKTASDTSIHTLSGQAWMKIARRFSEQAQSHSGKANAAIAFRKMLWSNDGSQLFDGR